MMTLVPPRVRNLGSFLPVVTGSTRTTEPSFVTVIWCFCTSTVLMTDEPIENVDVYVRRPQTPGDSSAPSTAAVTWTFVPAGQKARGRHQTDWSLIQCQPPSSCCGAVDTVSARTAASRFRTGRANWTLTGIP